MPIGSGLSSVLTTLLTIALFYFGLPIPYTDADEYVRESLQRLNVLPGAPAPVRFSKIRPVYHAHVRYVIDTGTYDVPRFNPATFSGIVVSKRAVVEVEAGRKFGMQKDAGVIVFGQLQVNGEKDKPVTFRRAGDDKP